MNKREKLWTDSILLGAALLVYASGLVMFFAFHIEHGCFRTETLGLSRLMWLNIHRLAAAAMLAAALVHAAASIRSVCSRIRRIFNGRAMRQDRAELFFYTAVATACVAGFSAWFFIAGSAPLSGPIRLGHVFGGRHHWIDVHNIAALVSIYPVINHVRRRWRALLVPAKPPASRRDEQADKCACL
ncbi:MAG: DUF4405 domain-containing protein [Myxococcota bacterium]